MPLLERYLRAIRPLLPREGREDILRELHENLLSQIDEAEARLGHPLTEAEREAIIQRHGHPVVVAARYRRRQFLIGPDLFPFYWLVLRIAIAGQLVVRLIIAAVLIAMAPDPSQVVASSLLDVPWAIVPTCFWITAVFAALEFFGPRFTASSKLTWSPSRLPADDNSPRVVSRPRSVADIVFGSAAVLWWQAVPVSPALVLGPAASFLALAPVWTRLHWPVLLIGVAIVVQAWFDLASPYLTRARVAFRLVTRAASVALFAAFLQAGVWVLPASGAASSKIAGVSNRFFLAFFLMAFLIALGQLLFEAFRMFRHSPLDTLRGFQAQPKW